MFNVWTQDEKFKSIAADVQGSAMSILHQKLTLLKPELRKLNQQQYAQISESVEAKHVELNAAQAAFLLQPSGVYLLSHVKSISVDMARLLSAEESFYEQKARVQRVKLDDQHTGRIHEVVKAKNSRNTIGAFV